MKKTAMLLLLMIGLVAAAVIAGFKIWSDSGKQAPLSEKGRSFYELCRIIDQTRIDAAEIKGLIEAREKFLTEQDLILSIGKALLEKTQSGQPITIDSVSYSREQISADLARREKQCQFLRQALTGGKIQLGKLEDMMASFSETIANDRLELTEAEADQVEIMAYQSAGVSAIKAKTTKSQARAAFEEELKRIQKSQRLDLFPDVLEEDFIPTTFWLRQVMIYQAEAEKKRQNEEAKYTDKLLIKAEEEEKRAKAAKEEQRRQAEAERKQKEAENQRRLQAETNGVPVCMVDDWSSPYVPDFLFINKNTGQRIPVSASPFDRYEQYCVKQMPIGSYHVEIYCDGRVYLETDVEVTKEVSASYDNKWYHCVVKASDGH